MSRIFNFSAGPAMLPAEVLARAGDEMLDWRGSGMSVMEMSHRGPEFISIADEAEVRGFFAPYTPFAGLAASFPDDPIVSEELPPAPGALGAPRFWLVDPIDGTKDFIRGEDGYSVMIGYWNDEEKTAEAIDA